MQARYYDPVIGRFYSNDPVGFRGVHSFNRYAYANNNPYKYVDPDGMSSEYSSVGEKEEEKRRERCNQNSNCTNFIFQMDEMAVRAKWGQKPEDKNGNPVQGRVSCNITCQKSALDWSKITSDQIMLGVLMHNYYHDQSDLADTMFTTAGILYNWQATGTYLFINWQTDQPFSRADLAKSIVISKALEPVIKTLGHGSTAATKVWEHNMWWLGNGLGFVPVYE